MNLLVIGISHKSAPIELRERISITKVELGDFISNLLSEFFNECFVLTTCNRTEIYGITKTSNVEPEQIIRWFLQYKAASEISSEYFYTFHNLEAVRHLFSVASGTDSLVTGDVQIMGQLKEAFHTAKELDSIGFFMTRLGQAACRVGKRSRSETLISEGTVSVSYAAVELLHDHIGDLHDKSALLVGAGKTGRLTAKHLVTKNIGQLYVSNRTLSKAEAIVDEVGGKVVRPEELQSAMENVDIVVTSVDTSCPVIGADLLEDIMSRRSNRPLYIVDIGMPRNVAPEASMIKNITLWDMNALSQVVDRNRLSRLSEVKRVEMIVEEECREFNAWYHSKRVGPTIHDLNHFFEEVRTNEVSKHLHRFDESERELVHLITRRIVNKLLHKPMVNLKGEPARGLQAQHEHSIRTLFELSKCCEN